MRITIAAAALSLLMLNGVGEALAVSPPSFLGAWGGLGSGPGQLSYPYGIVASPDGSLYISDQYNYRIVQYTVNGEFVRSWGSQGGGPGQFERTIGLGIDPAGRVYVADHGNHRVQVFDRDGVFIRQWPAIEARDVAIGPDGSVHVVAHEGVRVDVFTQTGIPVRSYGAGHILYPASITFDAHGNSYVLLEGGLGHPDRPNVTKWGPAGDLLAAWAMSGLAPGQVVGGSGIAVDGAGNVYVVEHAVHRAQVFSPTGLLLTVWGGLGSGQGLFDQPVDVAVDMAGLIYVVDMFNHRIQKFGQLPTSIAKISWGNLKSRFR